MKKENEKKRGGPNRFLIGSFLGIIALTFAVFVVLAHFLDNMSADTISQVGEVYMKNLSKQISMHFQTTIDLRLDQVQTIVSDVRPEFERGNVTRRQVLEELEASSKARGFVQLGLLSYDGEFEMIYGDPLHITDSDPFLHSLTEGQAKVAVGKDPKEDDRNMVLLGVPADYLMKDGSPCLALVATTDTDYIKETLSLDANDSLVYSFIIRGDGSFVIRTGGAFRQSYFDRVRNIYTDVNGMTGEEYIADLSAAIKDGRDYSSEFTMESGERRRIFGTPLAYSEWYLLTFMPYGQVNSSIDHLGQMFLRASFVCCAVIFAAFGVVFFLYLRINRRQLAAMEEAREAAENALTLAVDARREAERARQNAERATKAKSEFLSNMSHDIRTPMNAIVGMTAIATANIDNTKQVQSCLHKITTSSRHLLGLINDVLDMSKIESGKMTLSYDRVSLRELMESIVSIVQPQVKAKRQEFGVSIMDISAENVLTDSVRLNQVLLNLLSNAVKFTPEEGLIRVSLKEEPSPRGEDHVRVLLCVQDNGIGMSPEFMEHIFDSFAREDSARVHRTEGTGLGMAITKYIVDAMGGDMKVKSKQGEGTEFLLTLDMEIADAPEADMVLPPWNMLVVDDDKLLCESTVKALGSIGISADWALSGESAIKMVEERHRRREDYHIILLDWKLPGMDGIATARELRRRLGDNNIPILIISAYDWSDIEKEAKAAGVSGFISKPLFKSTLFYGLRGYAGMEMSPEVIKDDGKENFSFDGTRVLVAEDNELNWEIASELLGEFGLQLDWAENGQICVDMIENSEPGTYKAVLMDIRMPVMNGFEATKVIRKMERPDKDMPIIAMTADAFFEDVQKCMEAGMNAHVAKPIDVREVCRLLKKYLEM